MKRENKRPLLYTKSVVLRANLLSEELGERQSEGETVWAAESKSPAQ